MIPYCYRVTIFRSADIPVKEALSYWQFCHQHYACKKARFVMPHKVVMTAQQAWEQLDSHAKLFVAAVNARNTAAMLDINVKIGSLIGYVLSAKQDADETEFEKKFKTVTPST